MKGQFTIVALFMVFITILVYIQIYPVLNEYIQMILPSVDPATRTILSLVPFFLLLAIIITAFYYAFPHRQVVE